MDRETIEKIITEIIEIEEKYKKEEEEDFKILKLKDQYNQKKYLWILFINNSQLYDII